MAEHHMTTAELTELKPRPRWTVVYNIVSKESDKWVGTGWEFFDDEAEAKGCYERQIVSGNCPTKRPYYENQDRQHLGAIHNYALADQQSATRE